MKKCLMICVVFGAICGFFLLGSSAGQVANDSARFGGPSEKYGFSTFALGQQAPNYAGDNLFRGNVSVITDPATGSFVYKSAGGTEAQSE
jgi:hypothetical protein